MIGNKTLSPKVLFIILSEYIKKYFDIFLFILLSVFIYINSFHIVNIIGLNIKYLIVINIFSILFMIDKKKSFFYLSLVVGLFYINEIVIVKALSYICVLYISYKITLKYNLLIGYILGFILVLNLLAIFFEMNYPILELLKYKTYHLPLYHPEMPSIKYFPLFLENVEIPLYQFRPSGIFNSTINFTMEIIFIIAILLYQAKHTAFILIGIFIAVYSGSDALLLTVFILPFLTLDVNNIKYIIITFVAAVFILISYKYLYPYFYSYNYGLEALYNSILFRLDFHYKQSSFTANNIWLSILFCIISIYFLLSSFKNKTIGYIYILAVLGIVMLLHNFIFSIKFYVYLGILLAIVNIHLNDSLKVKNKIGQRDE